MYAKFSEAELMEAYQSMKAYSGSIDATLLQEIKKRGGMDLFLKKMEADKLKKEEVKRISAEIYTMTTSNINIDFIKDHIHSALLTKEELEQLIEEKFTSYSNFTADTAITAKTIIGGTAGAAIGIIAGSILVYFFAGRLGGLFYLLLIPVYLICYLSIRLITRQSRKNIVVFLLALISCICAFLLGLNLWDFFS